MSRIPPFHTYSAETDLKNWIVYHDNDDCPDGKKILPQHRAPGTGLMKSRCKTCMELGHRSEDPA